MVVGGISGGPTGLPLLLLPPLPLPDAPLLLPLAVPLLLLVPLLPPLLPPELPPLPPLLPPSGLTYTTVVVLPQAAMAARDETVKMSATPDPIRFPFICAPSVRERRILSRRRD
jgi:hypothetical protein